MPFLLEIDFSSSIAVAPMIAGDSRRQTILRQKFELRDAQIGQSDEVLDVAQGSGGGLRLLEQAVHRLEVGAASSVERATHAANEVPFQGERQPLEGLQVATARLAQAFAHGCLHNLLAIARPSLLIAEAPRQLEAPGTSALRVSALQRVNRRELSDPVADQLMLDPHAGALCRF